MRLARRTRPSARSRSNESVTLRPGTGGPHRDDQLQDGVAVAKVRLLVALDAATQAAGWNRPARTANLTLDPAAQQGLFERKFISSEALDASAAALRIREAAVALAEAKLGETADPRAVRRGHRRRSVSIGDYVGKSGIWSTSETSRPEGRFACPGGLPEIGQLRWT